MTDISLKAKATLIEYVSKIDKKLSDYWDSEIAKNFGFNERQKILVREMLIHSKEHNLRPAKRLRGSFVNYAYTLSGKEVDERLWQAAMAVELVHTGILMHDDFMDRDEIRRRGLTTHKYYQGKGSGDLHYGESMAVNVGDAVWNLGDELLASCGFESEKTIEALKKLFRGIVNTAYGQAFDVTLEVMGGWTEEDVISLHRAKTGIYTYENPLLIGAILGGLDEKAKNILTEYSIDGGVAFQLQDDILGVFGTEEDTGKSADSDLRQGKCTLLILKAQEMGTKQERKAVEDVWGDMEASRIKLDLAKRAIEECGSLEYNRSLAREFAKKAAAKAGELRDLNLDPEAIDYIQGIAEYMVARKV